MGESGGRPAAQIALVWSLVALVGAAALSIRPVAPRASREAHGAAHRVASWRPPTQGSMMWLGRENAREGGRRGRLDWRSPRAAERWVPLVVGAARPRCLDTGEEGHQPWLALWNRGAEPVRAAVHWRHDSRGSSPADCVLGGGRRRTVELGPGEMRLLELAGAAGPGRLALLLEGDAGAVVDAALAASPVDGVAALVRSGHGAVALELALHLGARLLRSDWALYFAAEALVQLDEGALAAELVQRRWSGLGDAGLGDALLAARLEGLRARLAAERQACHLGWDRLQRSLATGHLAALGSWLRANHDVLACLGGQRPLDALRFATQWSPLAGVRPLGVRPKGATECLVATIAARAQRPELARRRARACLLRVPQNLTARHIARRGTLPAPPENRPSPSTFPIHPVAVEAAGETTVIEWVATRGTAMDLLLEPAAAGGDLPLGSARFPTSWWPQGTRFQQAIDRPLDEVAAGATLRLAPRSLRGSTKARWLDTRKALLALVHDRGPVHDRAARPAPWIEAIHRRTAPLPMPRGAPRGSGP